MALHRRSFLKLAGIAGTSGAFGISAPAIVRAATPIKVTLPWLPLGTYSFTFVAKKLGYWEKRGLDVTIDRGFGSVMFSSLSEKIPMGERGQMPAIATRSRPRPTQPA